MRRFVLPLSLALGAGAAGFEWTRMTTRLDVAERRALRDANRLSELESALRRSAATVDELVRAAGDREERLYRRLAGIDRTVHEARDDQSRLVRRLGSLEASAGAPEVRHEIEALSSLLAEREAQIAALERTSDETARLHRQRLDELQRCLEEQPVADLDASELWNELVGPSVQISGDETVGSGVLLRSERLANGQWRTHALTAWHVVRDLFTGSNEDDPRIPVKIYDPSGRYVTVDAELLTRDTRIDVALLELVTEEPFQNGVRLASRDRLRTMRVFDPIYAVGCPLGNDPIPTRGELSSTAHVISGETYWMVSAPTYIGNSGGGIFDARTNELVGIFSKIYTHGSLRSTIVPHMGLATPLSTIYDWLDGEGYAHLVDGDSVEARTASLGR